jgi:hypothetical protein
MNQTRLLLSFWEKSGSMKVKPRRDKGTKKYTQFNEKASEKKRESFFISDNRGAIEVLFSLDVEALDDETLCSRLAISFSLCFTRFTRHEEEKEKINSMRNAFGTRNASRVSGFIESKRENLISSRRNLRALISTEVTNKVADC